jgi:hypothetical protein
MFAKSFIALDGNGRLTGAKTAQTAPYDRYCCHLCGSALSYHPEFNSERPWFEHTKHGLTDNGFHHCPYVKTAPLEVKRLTRLRQFVAEAAPVVYRAKWFCTLCSSIYHGERYCLNCHTGDHSTENAFSEVT